MWIGQKCLGSLFPRQLSSFEKICVKKKKKCVFTSSSNHLCKFYLSTSFPRLNLPGNKINLKNHNNDQWNYGLNFFKRYQKRIKKMKVVSHWALLFHSGELMVQLNLARFNESYSWIHWQPFFPFIFLSEMGIRNISL